MPSGYVSIYSQGLIRRYDQHHTGKVHFVIWREGDGAEAEWHLRALSKSFSDMSPSMVFPNLEKEARPEGLIRLSRKSAVARDRDTLLKVIELASEPRPEDRAVTACSDVPSA